MTSLLVESLCRDIGVPVPAGQSLVAAVLRDLARDHWAAGDRAVAQALEDRAAELHTEARAGQRAAIAEATAERAGQRADDTAERLRRLHAPAGPAPIRSVA